MPKNSNKYITLEEFAKNSGVKEKTIKKNYKMIPGIAKNGDEYLVLSGTRYPYNLRGNKLKDASSRCYVALKAISEYRYISHKELRVEESQFQDILKELERAGYIRKNRLSNRYGANGYDGTLSGAELLEKGRSSAIRILSGIDLKVNLGHAGAEIDIRFTK